VSCVVKSRVSPWRRQKYQGNPYKIALVMTFLLPLTSYQCHVWSSHMFRHGAEKIPSQSMQDWLSYDIFTATDQCLVWSSHVFRHGEDFGHITTTTLRANERGRVTTQSPHVATQSPPPPSRTNARWSRHHTLTITTSLLCRCDWAVSRSNARRRVFLHILKQ
jgi:hypothetical protein